MLETGTAGTHTITPVASCTVNVILVGGGGGGSSCHYSAWERGRNGGQGAMVSGQIRLTKGTQYTVVVGAAGVGQRLVDNGGSAQGTDGGASTAFGNTAGGGKGSGAHTGWFDGGSDWGGDGGTATAVSGFTGSNGAATTTTSKYGSYGGGGIGNASTAGNGQSGYVKVSVVSS